MLQKYKEVLFGLAFGIGAVVLDTVMDAIADGNGFMDEVVEQPGMMLYRLLFIIFGLVLGWLLWERNRGERETRQLAETLNKVRRECGSQGLILRSALQTILTRDDLHLSDEALRLLQEAYAKSQDFQRIADDRPPQARRQDSAAS